jgi:alkylation response protein AidB-like acyl-CoA dehydrogenase
MISGRRLPGPRTPEDPSGSRSFAVNLDFTDRQQEFADVVRGFFDKETPIEVVRAAEPLGFDRGLWDKAVQMGLTGMTVPESRGGGGAEMVDVAIVAECLGEHLAPVPVVEAVVATHLLAETTEKGKAAGAGADDLPELVTGAVEGRLMATLALHPVLAGTARLVPAGAVADLVVALDGERLVLIRQDGGEAERPPAAVPNLGALPVADCPLDGARTVVLAEGAGAVDAYRRAVSRWRLLTGTALAGLGARALAIGREYVLERRAFGVLIANFQTVQHRLADNVTSLEGARLLAYEAAWAQDAGLASADSLATMAFLFAAETAGKTTADSLQVHGGYGYTLEYDIQLYYRRAKAWPLVAGDPRHLYAGLAQGLYDTDNR